MPRGTGKTSSCRTSLVDRVVRHSADWRRYLETSPASSQPSDGPATPTRITHLTEGHTHVLPKLPLTQQREVLSILRVRVMALDSRARTRCGLRARRDNLFGHAWAARTAR
jgi:hypothetical protein